MNNDSPAQEGTRTEVLQARYARLLQTADWRAFAWKVKQASGFRCACCPTQGERESLEVHHWWYDWQVPGWLPWQVEPGQVCVLCASCHGELERQWATLKRIVEGRWAAGPVGNGLFVQLVARYLFAGFTPGSLGEFNARLMLGAEAGTGPLASAVVVGMAGVERKRREIGR